MQFTDSHEWITEEGRVGITAYARRELGDIVYVELPLVGRRVKKGEEVVVLESTKAAADIYSPVSGEVVAVNEELRGSPDLVNQSPEEKGWLFQIRPFDADELRSLMDAQDYQRLIQP